MKEAKYELSIQEEIQEEFRALSPGVPNPPQVREEAVIYDEHSRSIVFSYNDKTTAAEETFKQALFRRLVSTGFSGEISNQESLVIPLEKGLKNPQLKSQLQSLVYAFKNPRFTIRKPDFLCLKYGLVIEIDGRVHDAKSRRVKRDNTRESELRILDLDCYLIRNEEIFDPSALNRHLDLIVQYLTLAESQPDFQKRYQKRRTALSRARKTFIQSNSSISIGSFNRSKPKTINFNAAGGVAKIQWGGLRFTFTPRRK